MIDAKAAVKNAQLYFQELFPEKAGSARLEEVELSPDKTQWSITISLPKPDLNVFGQLMSNPTREYKEIAVDASTGNFLSIKIKVPQGA